MRNRARRRRGPSIAPRRSCGVRLADACGCAAPRSSNSGSTSRSRARTESNRSCGTCTPTSPPSPHLMTTTTTTDTSVRDRIAEEIRKRQRFVISSHVRPDGDAIGSQLAMAFALRHLGKTVRVVNCDMPPSPMLVFPGVADIEVAQSVNDPGDAVIIMECGDFARTGVTGLDRGFVINIDHHLGNTMYGARNCGGTYEDTEGLINLPLTVKEIQAVVFFKEQGPEDWRISMRSKGEIDINSVAKEFGGGGHKNAAGCSATGTFDELTALFRKKITEQIDKVSAGV